jgi:hypothetical protein
LGTILAALAAAIAAYESRETARFISEVEQRRLIYERNKLSADVYQKYADFIRTAPPIRPCLAALKDINDSDFRTLLDKPDKFQFRQEQPTHVALSQCLQKEEDRKKYKSSPDKWESDQSTSARGTIVIWLNQLDAYFLAFKYEVGNPGILCRNMMSIFDTAPPKEHPIKGLLLRMNKYGLLENEGYVKDFLENYGGGKKPCPPTDIARDTARSHESLIRAVVSYLTPLPEIMTAG